MQRSLVDRSDSGGNRTVRERLDHSRVLVDGYTLANNQNRGVCMCMILMPLWTRYALSSCRSKR